MEKTFFLFITLAFLSCKKEPKESVDKPTEINEGMPAVNKTPEALGKEIFEGKGNCIACHQVNRKIIGPSLQDIAKIYKDKNGDMVLFLKGKSEPLVDPSQYDVMKANFAITKGMSDEELMALQTYIYSNLK